MIVEIQVPASSAVGLKAALAALCTLNVLYLRSHPNAPGLYQSGVRYRRERQGREKWQTIPILYHVGFGDCEDLTAARVAELIVRHGERAQPEVRRIGPRLWHVLVLRASGLTEDPSARLGMRGDE